jgi:hypothetical protein
MREMRVTDEVYSWGSMFQRFKGRLQLVEGKGSFQGMLKSSLNAMAKRRVTFGG